MSHTGCIFEFTIGSTPAKARVLLDVLDTIKRRQLPDESPLAFFQDSLLIEVFGRDDQPITPSFFCNRDGFTKGLWKEQSRQPVLPEQLEFPVFLKGFRSEVRLVRGEISITIDLPFNEFLNLDLLGSTHSASTLAIFAAALRDLPTPDGSPAEYAMGDLAESDLRIHEDGSRFFQMANCDPNESYCEFSRRHGIDPARLLNA